MGLLMEKKYLHKTPFSQVIPKSMAEGGGVAFEVLDPDMETRPPSTPDLSPPTILALGSGVGLIPGSRGHDAFCSVIVASV